MSGKEILEKCITTHDPESKWNTLTIDLQIQEPRIKNPFRYSKVKLNNKTGAFELQRNRANSVSKHIIDAKGKAKTLLDGKIVLDSDSIKKFRLNPESNHRYKKFYEILLGLPMSLEPNIIEKIGNPQKVTFNRYFTYKIEIQLKEALFSKHWNIFIDTKSMELVGIEIFFPEDDSKGERFYFEGKVKIENSNIIRIRHWHEFKEDVYSGSDIIMN